MRCYIFDIDGTIADGTHRLDHIKKEPKDWDTYFSLCHLDEPIPHIVELACDLSISGRHIIYVSGRSDVCEEQTRDWMGKHGLPDGDLHMRKQGDHRNDDVLKAEMLAAIRAEGWRPIMAFDDRNRVVKAWRDNGVPCAQVAEGDF
jgi:hypothetical protein